MFNSFTDPYTRTVYDLKGGLILSVITGSGTYSRKDLNDKWCEVEIAIQEMNDGDIRYDMTGGDVCSYFPADKIEKFVEWFNNNCESKGFFQNPNGSNKNLPLYFLMDLLGPQKENTFPMYEIPAKDFNGSMQHRLY